jgi:hypothetical protein
MESPYDDITLADILATFPPGAARALWLKWLIQQSPRRGTAWPRTAAGAKIRTMLLDLTDLELEPQRERAERWRTRRSRRRR